MVPLDLQAPRYAQGVEHPTAAPVVEVEAFTGSRPADRWYGATKNARGAGVVLGAIDSQHHGLMLAHLGPLAGLP